MCARCTSTDHVHALQLHVHSLPCRPPMPVMARSPPNTCCFDAPLLCLSRLVALSVIAMPEFKNLSLERQRENMTAGNVWGFSTVYVFGGALLGVAVHGPSKLEMSGFEVIDSILRGFRLFKSVCQGIMGPMDRAHLRRRASHHLWLPLRDVVSTVRDHLEACSEDDEWLFLAFLAEQYRWASVAADFRSLQEADFNNLRRILKSTTLAV